MTLDCYAAEVVPILPRISDKDRQRAEATRESRLTERDIILRHDRTISHSRA